MSTVLFALLIQAPTLWQGERPQEEPLFVSLSELSQRPSLHDDRRIRTTGEWEIYQPAERVQMVRDGADSLCVSVDAPTGLPELLGKRVEITGRFVHSPLTQNHKVLPSCSRFYLRADEVMEARSPSISRSEPSAPTEAQRPGRSESPPEILFTTPRSGTREIALDTNFTIHFSRPMDESTFRDHVFVRQGAIGEVPASEVQVEFSYDEESKTLSLTPTMPLGKLKLVQIVLHRGIAGSDGTPLHVEPPPPKNIASRRAAQRRGEDLDELLVLEFTTRGY